MKGEKDPWADGKSCSSRRGARARFDNASHAGRHSPVREALRLPDELEGSDSDTHCDTQRKAAALRRAQDGGTELVEGAAAANGATARSGRKRRVTAEEVALRRRHRAETRGPSGGSSSTSPPTSPLTPERRLDPWAGEEPVFGQREVAHALSPTPGTPPLGHLAVSVPTSSPRDEGAAQTPPALSALSEPIRVELELEHCARWTCGLVEKASPAGLEVSLGFRGIGTRDFLSAGRRVRLLVSPHNRSGSRERPFQLYTRILWVDPPSGPSGAVRAQLAVDTADTGALTRWQGLVERLRR